MKQHKQNIVAQHGKQNNVQHKNKQTAQPERQKKRGSGTAKNLQKRKV